MKKILIVDDEKYARETVEAMLFNCGYELVFCESAIEALEKIDSINPDLILSDVMMPVMDGFEFSKILKADKAKNHIPIILLTALNSKEDLAHGLECGADDFIGKPVNKLELRARVHSMLRLKEATDRLRAMTVLREDLSSMIVHDVRTPLQVISMSAGLLEVNLEEGITEDVSKAIQAIKFQAKKINSFLNDLLLTAKMENEKVVLNCRPLAINSLIKEAVDCSEHLLNQKEIKIKMNLIPDETFVELDYNLFARVFDNLISNAAKYSKMKSILEIQTEKIAKKLIIRVKDQGYGIPDENKQTIFSKFEIVNLRKKGTVQVGLGLAFVRLIVEAHNGTIRVEDNQPKGSVFVIELPLS